MATRKYVSFSNLSKFLDNIKNMFTTKTEVDTKSDKNHTHTIANIANLQTALDGKAASSHGTHVTYSSTAPLMDGTASVGSASTVARSDHKHPIDTSRAAQTSLDTHTSNTTSHITSAERANWNTAYNHSQSAHAPSNAEPNQNAFSNVKVGDVTIAADIKTDTLTLVAGNNVTITTDATNDKITISAKDTTYSLGSFGITATAAELNKLDGVTATATELNYVDGVTSNIQNQIDGKAASSHTHKVANISDLTATATELNYMDGVTSNVQTQLDGKASSGHTHKYAGSSSSGGAATSANKLNTNDGSATQPVYFANGIPVATTYTLGKSVPSNAVFTDTHYTSKNVVGATNATSNTATALSNGAVYLNSVENGAVTSSHKISGSGATTVTTDTNGNIVISSTDNNTTYNAAGSALGLVKSGGDVTISSGVITVNDDSHNHTISNIDNLQSSLDAKQNTITGGASTIATSNLTVNRALVSNGSGKVAVSAVTSTELGYLDGVTSNVQTQLDGKAASSHTHKYAGSSSVGGSATSAVKLDTSTAGDSNTPVYFSGGKPVACTSLDLNTSGSSASCTGNSATATKLQTARSIGLGNDLTGSANFDGSGNITISVKHYNASVNSGNKSNYPYHRFAYRGSKTAPVASQYNDTDAIFCIRETYNGGGYGILKVSLRTNASTSTSQASATWLARYNFALDDVKIGLYNVAGATYADLYIKVGTYARTVVYQFEGNRSWTLVASNEVNDTTTSDKKTSTECYASIENAATTLHGQAYSLIISSVDGGQVNYANSSGSCSGNSATATKLSSAKTISLTGDVTGSVSFDGSANASITATVKDDSHNHVISNVDNLQTTLDSLETALDGKAASSHTHKYAGSSSAGGAATSANKLNTNAGDSNTPVYFANGVPVACTSLDLNTSGSSASCTGNAATATKLATARTISLSGDVTGSTSFDGSGNVSITATVADDSHNHIISNIDNLQSTLDGKSSTSHTHTADNLVQWANALFATASNGGVEYSYSTGSGKNVLTEISNMTSGLHTIYSIAGTTGNPKSDESWRMLVHKTSTTIGWVLAFDAQGSIYSNYQSAAGTFKGWRCIYDADPPILWMGEYWCTDTQTVTPSKALSACRNGWVLVWSDYDTENEKATNGDCFTTVIPKWNPNHVKWSGQSFIAAVPTNLSETGTISFAGKRLYVHDTKITGNTVNDVNPSNDVCLRAIYEY